MRTGDDGAVHCEGGVGDRDRHGGGRGGGGVPRHLSECDMIGIYFYTLAGSMWCRCRMVLSVCSVSVEMVTLGAAEKFSKPCR